MKAADIMTGQVVTIGADAPITKAVELMLQNHISGLPVVDSQNRVVGMVTEGDFLRRTETGTEVRRLRWVEFLLGPGRGAKEYVRTHARLVAEVMTSEVVCVTEGTPVAEVVRFMEKRRIKRVPVVRHRKIVGIISRANLLRALAGIIAEVQPTAESDSAIRKRILAELEKQSWAPRVGVNVMVRNGIVEFWGAILDEREREAFRVAAENVAGVKGVHDHLCWVEPMSGFVIEPPEGDAQPNAAAAQ